MPKDEDRKAAGLGCADTLQACGGVRLAIFLLATGWAWAAAWAAEPATTLRTGPAPFDEELPPIGKGQLLPEEQVAYCLAQIIRLDAVRPLVDRYRKAQVENFNALAGDYTKRCGSYMYEGNTREIAKGLVEANRARIEGDARAAYTQQFPEEEKEVAQGKSAAPAKPVPQREPAQEPATSLPAAAAVSPSSSEQPPGSKPVPAPQPTAAQKPEAPSAAQKAEAAAAAQKAAAAAAAQRAEAAAAAQKAEAAAAAQKAEAAAAAQKAEAAAAAQKAEAAAAAQKPATPLAAQKSETPSSTVARSSPAKSERPAQSKPASGQLAPAKANQEADADAVLERYAKEIRQLGSRVLDQRDYLNAPSGKQDLATEIEVRYAAGGYIKSIDLGESSGYEVLDERALAICRSMRFPRVPAELHSRDFTVRFPIVFRAPKSG